MMDGRLFDTLEAVARKVRGSAAPFGGIQVGAAEQGDLPHVCGGLGGWGGGVAGEPAGQVLQGLGRAQRVERSCWGGLQCQG